MSSVPNHLPCPCISGDGILIKAWRALPLIFLIFQQLIIFRLWLHIHQSFGATQMMQCSFDFDHAVKKENCIVSDKGKKIWYIYCVNF